MNTDEKKYNKEQLKAVTHRDGSLLIVAGAGTGKTTVLIGRLEYLIKNKLANSDEVLLLTFTEKATGEMEDRALKTLPYGYVDLWINTFHGFCERVLRDYALDIGINSDFNVLSQTEQWILIKKNLDEFNLSYYKPVGNPNKFIYELVKHFSRLKDENIKPEEYLDYAKKLKEKFDSITKKGETDDEINEQEVSRISELANAYRVYNNLLLQNGFLDFGDLINYTLDLFEKRPNILKIFKDKFKYIMVDEFQDTNWAQYELVKKLAEKTKNLMVVGDDDQAIYKFRGASISNIMQFQDDYPSCKQIILTNNYRSGKVILDSAYNFIQHNNPNRLEIKLKIDKQLNSNIKNKGSVQHHEFGTEQEEVAWVVEDILNKYNKEEDIKWSDFAILIRANSQAEKFIQELKRRNIPNLFLSLKGLYYKDIIVDCLAYFRLLDNYHESSALFRVLNMDVFRVAHKDIIHINKFARKKVWSLYEALKNIKEIPNLEEATTENVSKLITLIEKHSIIVKKEKPSKVMLSFIWDAGLNKKDYDRSAEYYSYLNQFYQKIKNFEANYDDARLRDYIEMLNLEIEAGETGSLKLDYDDDEVVKIMTTHSAKGLEFKNVYIVDLVDKRFPTINRKEKIMIPDELVREKLPEGSNVHIEEERRLFYVAMTRAKENLELTSARDHGGAREKKKSVFVEEADIDTINQENDYKTKFEIIKDLENHNDKPVEKVNDVYQIPHRFSFSQIEAYSNCPLQYKFNFILKIPVVSKENFIFGRVMHNTLRYFLEQTKTDMNVQLGMFDSDKGKNTNKPSLDRLQMIFEDNWVSDGYESKQSREDYYKKGKESLNIFYKHLETEGWPEPILLEKVFNMRFGDYFFRGAIDRVDRIGEKEVEVIDYKTGNPKEKLDYKTKKQLILYKIALEQLGLNATKLSFYYLENGAKLSFEAKPKEEEKLKEQMLNTIQEIKKCQFNAKPSMLCAYCDFGGICEFKKV